MCVEEVGTGVGKEPFPSYASRDLFNDLGNAGGEEKGSNAGRREAAGFFFPASVGCVSFLAGGSSIALSCRRGLVASDTSLFAEIGLRGRV